jgi:TP901 family phage tail tape measure protein
MAGRFSVEAVFKAVDRVTAPVTRMQNQVGKLTRGMGRGFHRLNRSVDKFTDGVKKGALAVTAALALTTGAMANVITTGADFEQTITAAAAKFPGEIRRGTAAFEALEAAARKTGATTEFTASQSAEALNFLAMAGFNAESSIAALPGVVDLATAAQVDLATATDVASDSLGAFNLMTKDSTQLSKNLARVNDVIAKTTTSANTTVETLFETIKDGAPVATSAGASLETFAALAGELANAGIKGTRAGTTLKNMFLKLAAPVAGGAKILRRLGIQTQDAGGDMRDIVDILGDLNKSLDGLGTAERAGVLEGIFGKIPIAGVNILLQSGSERLREYRKELEGASGASTVMAAVMRDTLQGRLNSLKSAVEGVKISIFSMTRGPLVEVVDKMTLWVRANEGLIASNIGEFLNLIITNFGTIVSALGNIAAGVASVMALGVALKAVSAILGVINLIMAANPIVLGIMAAVAAVALLSGKLDPVLDVIKSIGSGIANAFSAVSSLGRVFGFGDEPEPARATAAQMVSPQERMARSIAEQRTTSTAEVTIRDETKRAEVTSGKLGAGVSIQQTGGF